MSSRSTNARLTAVVAVVATLAVGLLVLAPGAFAKSDADAEAFASHRAERGAERLERRASCAEELGGELGVGGDEVEAALRTMLQRRVDDALADGRLEAEGAERIMACYDTAECPPHRLWRLLRHHW